MSKVKKVGFVGLLALVIGAVILSGTALAYSTGFEEFAEGTPAESLTVPGMSFAGVPGNFVVGDSFFVTLTGHVLLNGAGGIDGPGEIALLLQDGLGCDGNVLRVTFDAPQSGVSFNFATASFSGVLNVAGYLGGSQVVNTSFVGTVPSGGTFPEGWANIQKTVDRIDISTPTDCLAVDNVNTSGVPGCDANIPIPSNAVVGAFVADAPLYWQPGDLTSPLVTIPAGNTAWVLGVDESGEYYKIIWVCDLLWVPVETMGPNYDDVWNGTPLPTSTVQ